MRFDCRRSVQVKVPKTKACPQAALSLFSIVTILSLLGCVPAAVTAVPVRSTETAVSNSAPSAKLVATSLTFIADADAQVNEVEPENNTGSSTFLHVDGADSEREEGFLRFTVTGISAPIHKARLRLYDTSNESSNGPAVYATEASWKENEITWTNRPARTSPELDNQESIGTATWVEYDVTLAITGNGTFSFVLAADSSDGATFSSRQGEQPPELVIILADGPTPTVVAAIPTVVPAVATSAGNPQAGSSLIFVAEADARVREADPTANYGSGTTLQVDGASDSDFESFLRFSVAGVSGKIQSARLRLYVVNNGTENGPAVHGTSNDWSERDITWSNRPAPTGEAVDNKENLSRNSWAEYDVTELVKGNGTFSFVLRADSSDAVHFSSRHGEQPPQLVLALGDTSAGIPAATPAGSANNLVLVGAGDISSCNNDNDELTAQLLDSIPGTVFTTGDNAYDSGTYNEYLNCYDPTWGRHKDRTRPTAGNHEYRTDGAAGYFQYFNNVPSYYAYSVGSWRIYALNSEIDVSGESSQVTWLKSDLASNPSQCVLAYWHKPRWSSGRRHGNNPDLQELWQVLYESGAELVLNGHEHNYERFAEMDASGAPVSEGLREIVVGTGGRNLYEFDSPMPASEVRNSSTFGVLKLDLRRNGYDWEFIPAAGASFTDRGSTNCH
jgi:hypothetical protein